MKITAKGRKDGHDITLIYDGEKIKITPEEYDYYDAEIEYHLQAGHPTGGTYYPGKKDVENVIEVMGNWFFDSPVIVKSEITAEIPWEKGVVY